MSDPTFPAPTTISEQARRRLAGPLQERAYPAAGDTDSWLAMADQADKSTAQRLSVSELSVTVEKLFVGGAVVYSARPAHADPSTSVYLWMHPGAFLVGGGEACRATTGMTAASVQMLTWGVDYGLPPRRPYPAGLDDAIAAYRGALEAFGSSRVFVGGTSSGGNLAAAMLLRARDEQLPMPAGVLLNTPAVDLTEAGDTFQTLAGVDVGRSDTRPVHVIYAAGAELTDPYLSPLFGDLAGFPPTFLQSGTRDTLLSNTVQMHRKLRAAGVEAELHVFEAMPHGGFGGQTPEDLELAAEQRRFLAAHGA